MESTVERGDLAATEEGAVITAEEATREVEGYARPAVDIYETSEGLIVLADMPGAGPDDLDIQVKDSQLTILAKVKTTLVNEPGIREFELTNYFRQFQLSEKVDASGITAELKHGVLTLNLPKLADAQPLRIPVRIG